LLKFFKKEKKMRKNNTLLCFGIIAGLVIGSRVAGITSHSAVKPKQTPIDTVAVTETTLDMSDSTVSDPSQGSANVSGSTDTAFSLSQVPEYNGTPYIKVNNGKPFFTAEDLENGKQHFIKLSDLDSLGRCGSNMMSADYADEASEDRGEIGSIKPTGWVQAKYDPEQTQSDSPYLYNRCHLLAYFLTGLNAEPKNLITGTRNMNIAGQLDAIETPLADYLEANPDKHVLYRVTPEFDGNDLLAKGVLSEAESVEDNGQGFEMCIFSYNAQPAVTIDYATGKSTGPKFTGTK
jgi:DNA-entry nuclease